MSHQETTKPVIKPVPMELYPTMESLQSVVDMAHSQLPGLEYNHVLALFMTYHNSLLQILEKETNYVPRKP